MEVGGNAIGLLGDIRDTRESEGDSQFLSITVVPSAEPSSTSVISLSTWRPCALLIASLKVIEKLTRVLCWSEDRHIIVRRPPGYCAYKTNHRFFLFCPVAQIAFLWKPRYSAFHLFFWWFFLPSLGPPRYSEWAKIKSLRKCRSSSAIFTKQMPTPWAISWSSIA